MPASTPDRFMDAIQPSLQKFADTQARRDNITLLKAVRLAPRLEIAEALLGGEPVPRNSLDPLWAKAYGL